MRSRSKWAKLSISAKSWSRIGPRDPCVSEAVRDEVGEPLLVVSVAFGVGLVLVDVIMVMWLIKSTWQVGYSNIRTNCR